MAEDKWQARIADRSTEDELVPLETLDPRAIEDFDGLLRAMAATSFGGRRLGEAAEVLEAMVTDPQCAVVLTLSGAMTVAKMNLVIAEMVERGWVQAIVSTGALMTHGLVELTGMQHFKAKGEADDAVLFERGYNRVYDTYELESNLNRLCNILDREVFPKFVGRSFGSWELLSEMGAWLGASGRRGLVSAAWRHGVPIYIPAFTDCEMALDLASYLIRHKMREDGIERAEAIATLGTGFDAFRDLTHYARMVENVEHLGIFTIGGGVPRNWAQQAPPFLDCLSNALGERGPMNRFRYGVRICPEPAHWGGLSGCTYSEGVSWGKFLPPSEGGRFAEIHADATTVWPLLVMGVAQRLDRQERQACHPPIAVEGYQPQG